MLITKHHVGVFSDILRSLKYRQLVLTSFQLVRMSINRQYMQLNHLNHGPTEKKISSGV
jgi:hypothetical protein